MTTHMAIDLPGTMTVFLANGEDATINEHVVISESAILLVISLILEQISAALHKEFCSGCYDEHISSRCEMER